MYTKRDSNGEKVLWLLIAIGLLCFIVWGWLDGASIDGESAFVIWFMMIYFFIRGFWG